MKQLQNKRIQDKGCLRNKNEIKPLNYNIFFKTKYCKSVKFLSVLLNDEFTNYWSIKELKNKSYVL